jgi:hypothetical protein
VTAAPVAQGAGPVEGVLVLVDDSGAETGRLRRGK